MNKRELYQRAQEFCMENHIDEYPVKIVNLCKKYGLEVYGENLPRDTAGFIVVQETPFNKYPTGKLIVYNKNENVGRQRFTIAHELAHFILHKKESDPLYAHRDAGNAGGIESEASFFAAQILMPSELVFKALENAEKEFRYMTLPMKARHIAREFEVSVEAAHVRLEQLGIFC